MHPIPLESVAPQWVYIRPDKVTFKCIQKAIIAANKAPPPSKKIAWKNVYELSRQYQRQEDAEKK
jgi:hypothetical protein